MRLTSSLRWLVLYKKGSCCVEFNHMSFLLQLGFIVQTQACLQVRSLTKEKKCYDIGARFMSTSGGWRRSRTSKKIT